MPQGSDSSRGRATPIASSQSRAASSGGPVASTTRSPRERLRAAVLPYEADAAHDAGGR